MRNRKVRIKFPNGEYAEVDPPTARRLVAKKSAVYADARFSEWAVQVPYETRNGKTACR